MPKNSIGTITQVIGAVVDVHFEGELESAFYMLGKIEEGVEKARKMAAEAA